MIRKFILTTLCLGVILGTFGVMSQSAHAQSADSQREGIAITPVRIRADYDAGSSQKSTVTVVNDGDVDFTFIVYARPYSVKGESYDPDFQTTSPITDAYRWIQFDKTSYTLAPHQRIDVPYTVTVPKGAAPGGHYGVIFAETQPAKTDVPNSVIRKKRVGAILYANVNGEVRKTGNILSTKIDFWQPAAPLSVSHRIQNSGNIDFVATQKFTVTDLFGSVKFTESKEYPILPDTTRLITMKWDKAPWFGLFKVSLETTALDKPSKQSGYVLILPRYVPLVIVIVLFIGGGYAVLRRRKRS